MTERYFEILAPLQDFRWKGDIHEISPGIKIVPRNQKPDLSKLKNNLAESEWDLINDAFHWLKFNWKEGNTPDPSAVVNLVLFALWLVKPTKTFIGYQFVLGEKAALGQTTTKRLLDRFAWIKGNTHSNFNDQDLQQTNDFYKGLQRLYLSQGRLNDALLLSVSGCWNHFWQTALICYAAATEAILTYSTEKGITRRLASSYACLVETSSSARDDAYKKFYKVYSVRSDIMHGRTHKIMIPDRLPLLVDFQEVLRKLWRTILFSPQLINILEETDFERKKYFVSLISDYKSPKMEPGLIKS